MANVNVKFNNKDYLLSCDDGQEENLKELAGYLDSKYNDLKKNLGNIGESKLLLITAIQMVDDYFDLIKKIENKKNDFEKLSTKFKELRSLAINYKEEKETEIENVKDGEGFNLQVGRIRVNTIMEIVNPHIKPEAIIGQEFEIIYYYNQDPNIVNLTGTLFGRWRIVSRQNNAPALPAASMRAGGRKRKIHIGSRGGKYYIKKGRKVYI